MTTAHRPTFDPAKGREHSNKASIKHARELPGQTKLKFRKAIKRTHDDFDDEEQGQDGEEKAVKKVLRDEVAADGVKDLKEDLENSFNDTSSEREAESDHSDEDDSDGIDSEVSGSESGSDEDEDEEDEEELMREFAKIKAERAAEQEKREKEQQVQRAMQSNPLLATSEKKVRKSWRHETVFAKQQGSSVSKEDTYSNDALRSDQHKKFMNKYIR
ncbi:unnamed protein product [Kuraishia capsulata CBS 1993]|uniref:Pre-mRNA-splicing factor CWC15 n=1 Tax=Kuraishia capsulata CBS 1993 TaxID=1382522 RepID=W6MKM3_9ASCO|nr:uncharacterized protein KUCA_T00001254001 [Kuraishia capsulata CBS 1993]CDK25287.1 unnamed protein product [Kuraishia capsulata CBS 1993]